MVEATDTNVRPMRPEKSSARRQPSLVKRVVVIATVITTVGGALLVLEGLEVVSIPWSRRSELVALEKRVERLETKIDELPAKVAAAVKEQ